ncbi:uncharacterized protein [Amphiura filiformis]|uniref:uncharacterized protein n=1 Tax=Amphiura filiformis TaxID=82378 RepID=UPI003B214E96
MTEACAVNVIQEGGREEQSPSAEGHRSPYSGTMACEDTAIAVLSSGLKRPVLNNINNDEGPAAKKQCLETKQDDVAQIDETIRKDVTSPNKADDKSTTKTSPGKPKYRASSPTIMTTRGKSHKCDSSKESTTMAGSHDIGKEGPVSASTSSPDGGANPRCKKSGTSCVVPGCHVTGWSNHDVKWYRIPKDERLRQIWLNKIGQPDLDLKDYHRICSSHFAGGCKTFDSIIPTIGVPTSPKKDDSISTANTTQGNKTQLVSNKKTFLTTKPWYSRWSITGNNSGSMCCIPGCKSTRRRNLALKYYRFPKEEKLRHQWLSSISVKNFMPRDNSRVCSMHFEGGGRSDKNSVPTIFSADTIALQHVRVHDQQYMIKQEHVDRTEEAMPDESVFYRQISPRKQAVPHRLPKAGPKPMATTAVWLDARANMLTTPS